VDEQQLLSAARGGDEDAFRRLVEPYRGELHAHCYRMLGSVHDAEDALQDGLLRAWRSLTKFEGRSSLRAWLYRISTNACLDLIARRPKRVLPIDYGPAGETPGAGDEPLVESIWVEPYPDEQLGLEQRESVELAFIAALQHLPARQRAALILRDVLGFSARETAAALETTVASANGLLSRARRAAEERLPEQSQQATLKALGDERLREIVESYTRALEEGDVHTVVAMLAEEAVWSMPPTPTWYRGLDQIVPFLEEGPMRVRWRHLPARANGQAAVGCYAWDPERELYAASVLDVLTLRGDRISEVTAFVDPGIFVSFGLPDTLPPTSATRRPHEAPSLPEPGSAGGAARPSRRR
jgi:RNA polymerase sigma-70 factor, ECF subfamily